MDTSEPALRIQLLPTVGDRVLVVGDLASSRTDDDWFTPGEVARLFEQLRLPRPGNVSEFLRRLEGRGLVRRRSTGGWSLTPLGKREVRNLVGAIDPTDLETGARLIGGAELGHVRHPLLPPELAPQPFVPAIGRMIDEFDFNRNVFCMSRFPSSDAADPLHTAIDEVRGVGSLHRLNVHVASDRSLDDDLWGNVAAHMWACRYGVALIEKRSRGVNENLLIEVGAMLAIGRRCALLKDKSVERLPTDFVGQIYMEIDLDDPSTVRRALHAWIAKDLGLGECEECAQ